ncbi:MAG TPA: hypothetical protein VN943_03245, partial [Candidatus Acidoferrum sp.]|nr:hypothetical protein [Candidatus Acidoferrum sp.]
MKVAQTQLRHADASTTSRYYLHVLGSEQRDAAEKVALQLLPDVAKSERKSVHVSYERPDTWVTVCTGHIGDTSSPRGGSDALEGVFGYGGTSSFCRPFAGR